MVKLLTLLELLSTSKLADLREIATARGINVAADAPKGDLIHTLAGRLQDPASLRAALDSLTIHERIAWNALVEEGGRMEGYGFPAHFGRVPREDPDAKPRRKAPTPRPPGVVYPGERLERLGLAFPASLPYYATYVPAEIMRLAGAPLAVHADPPRPITAPVVFSPACDIIGALVTYLSYCRNRRVGLTVDDELHQRHLVDLARLLWPQFQMVDGMYAEFDYDFLKWLRRLLRRLRLVESADRALIALPKAETWLSLPRRDLLIDIRAAFFRDSEEADYVIVERPHGGAGPKVTSLRTALLDSLAQCPTGQWIATADLTDYTYQCHPKYVRSWEGSSGYYRYGEPDDALPVSVSWSPDEVGSVTRWLCNSLRWMGLVDTASGAEAVRLTSLGAFLLGKSPVWEDEPQPRHMVVQPSFEVIVPAEAAPLTVYRLEQMADHISRDRAAIYTISQPSIRRAMEQGQTTVDILSFLAESAGRELPQNVAVSIRGWAERFGELDIRHLTVMQTANEDLITELSSSAKIKLKLGQRLGTLAVAVANDDLPALIIRLRKAGYSPRLGPQVDKPGAASAESVTLPESELEVLVAAAMALNENCDRELVSSDLIKGVQRRMSPYNDRHVDRLARSLCTDLTTSGKRVRAKPGHPAARFARTHTEPELLKAIKDRRPVTMEYYNQDAGEFSLEILYPKSIEAVHGTDLLRGEAIPSGHQMAYFMDHIRAVRPGAYAPAPRNEED